MRAVGEGGKVVIFSLFLQSEAMRAVVEAGKVVIFMQNRVPWPLFHMLNLGVGMLPRAGWAGWLGWLAGWLAGWVGLAGHTGLSNSFG